MKGDVTPEGSGSSAGGGSTTWEIVITDWALDAYLNLKHAGVFTDKEYWTVLRPDVELLRSGIPSPHPKFKNPKFWGPAKVANVILRGGYKMKWHQIGAGKVQLRLCVMEGSNASGPAAFLCEAYVKPNAAAEQRKLANFKRHMNKIARGRYVYRGQL